MAITSGPRSALGTDEPLDGLRIATERAAVLRDTADHLVKESVDQCISEGCTWEEVGELLGITRQAAQQRYPTKKPTTLEDDMDTMNQQLQTLVNGPTSHLADVRRSTGGKAGVFTLWCGGRMVNLGHARLSAEEARESNRNEADGANGRLCGIRRQPTKSLQNTMFRHFASDINNAHGATLQKQVSAVLVEQCEYRLVETDCGADAVRLFEAAKEWLPLNGIPILSGRS